MTSTPGKSLALLLAVSLAVGPWGSVSAQGGITDEERLERAEMCDQLINGGLGEMLPPDVILDTCFERPRKGYFKVPEGVVAPLKCGNWIHHPLLAKEIAAELGVTEADSAKFQPLRLWEVYPPFDDDPNGSGEMIRNPECTEFWMTVFDAILKEQYEEVVPVSTHIQRFADSYAEASRIPIPREVPRLPGTIEYLPLPMSLGKLRPGEFWKIFENSLDKKNPEIRDDTDDPYKPAGLDPRTLIRQMGFPKWLPAKLMPLSRNTRQQICSIMPEGPSRLIARKIPSREVVAETEFENRDLFCEIWRQDVMAAMIEPPLFDLSDIAALGASSGVPSAPFLSQARIPLSLDEFAADREAAMRPPGNYSWGVGRLGVSIMGDFFEFLREGLHVPFHYDTYTTRLDRWRELAPKVLRMERDKRYPESWTSWWLRHSVGERLVSTDLSHMRKSRSYGMRDLWEGSEPPPSQRRGLPTEAYANLFRPELAPLFWEIYYHPYTRYVAGVADKYDADHTRVAQDTADGLQAATIALLLIAGMAAFSVATEGVVAGVQLGARYVLPKFAEKLATSATTRLLTTTAVVALTTAGFEEWRRWDQIWKKFNRLKKSKGSLIAFVDSQREVIIFATAFGLLTLSMGKLQMMGAARSLPPMVKGE